MKKVSTLSGGSASASVDAASSMLSAVPLGSVASSLIIKSAALEVAPLLPDTVTSRTTYKVSHHVIFKVAVNFTVLLNAIQMGVAADHNGGTWDEAWEVCDHFFTAVFAAETMLLLFALRAHYFKDPWNYVDFGIAIIAVIDTWILPLAQDSKSDFGTLRVFRLLRLLRLLKAMRMRPELMTVVEGLIASMKSMFWIFVLLFIVLYSAGICCVEMIGTERGHYPARTSSTADINDEVVNSFNSFLYFGTVTRAMLSLLNVVLMADWNTVVRPVFEMQKVMVIFFVVVAIFCSFGLLNVIIGVVVERTTEAMNGVRLCHLEEAKAQQMREATALAEVMFALDADGNDRISRKEMELGASDPRLLDMFNKMELPIDFSFGELFVMLDVDGSGVLSRQEFVGGMIRMIYNTNFQRDCMLRCAQGQMKQAHFQLRKEIKMSLKAVSEEVRKDIEDLKAALLSNANCTDQPCAAAPEPSVPSLPMHKDISLELHKLADALEKSGSISYSGSGFDLGHWAAVSLEEVGKQSAAVQFESATRGNNSVPIDTAQVSVELQSSWEPLQTSIMPLRLVATNAQLEAAVSGRVAGAALKSAGQHIVGFLPVVGSLSNVLGTCETQACKFPL